MAITFSEKHYTTAQAALILRVQPATVKRYCNQYPPRIKAEKVGNSWMIPKSALDQYLRDESEYGRPKNRTRKTG